MAGVVACAGMLLSCGGGDSGSVSPNTTGSSASIPGISLLAGNIGGPGYVDAVGTDARFEALSDVIAADPAGNVFVLDNQILRKIAADGTVTTLAGQRGAYGRLDGKGSAALFGTIGAMTADAAGNVYLIDSRTLAQGSGAVRKVTPDGTVTTLANSDQVVFCVPVPGPFTGTSYCTPRSTIAVDSAGTVYTTGNPTSGNNAVWQLTAGGAVTQLAETAGALAVDASNNLYIANYTDHTIRKRPPGGQSTLLLSSSWISIVPGSTASIAAEGNGTLYLNIGFAVLRIDPVHSGATLSIGDMQAGGISNDPPVRLRGTAIAADGQGNAFQVGDLTVRKITAAGTVYTFAGAGPLLRGYADSPGPAARLQDITDLMPDAAGNIYVTDQSSASVIRKIDPFGGVTTPAGNPGEGGSTDGPLAQATFMDLVAVRLGPSGTVYVLQDNHRLRRISPDGVVTTTILPTAIPANCATDFVVDAQENLYFSCAVLIKVSPSGAISAPWNPGVDLGPTGSLSGALANVSAASNTIYHQPLKLAIDADGNLYGIASGDPIMKFRADGLVEPVANSQTANPRRAVAIDSDGTLYVAEVPPADSNLASKFGSPVLIRKITPAGEVTVAGTPGVFGTVLGGLPGALVDVHAMRFIAPKTLAIGLANGVLKVVVP